MAIGQQPPHVPGDPVRIQYVPVGPTLSVLFLGPYQGVSMHWYERACRPCGGPEACPSVWHKVPPVWFAYAPAEVWRGDLHLWLPCVIELTAHCVDCLTAPVLRGQVWKLTRRPGRGKASAVDAVFHEQRPETGLRPFFDIRPVCEDFWRTSNVVWDVPNPKKPKLILEASAGVPPAGWAQPAPERKAEVPPPEVQPVARLDLSRVIPFTVDDLEKKSERNGSS